MKKQDRQTTAICIRLDNDTLNQLDALCTAFQIKRSEVIASQIRGNYDKMNGSPAFNAMITTMQEFTAKLKEQAQAIANENESSHTDGKV